MSWIFGKGAGGGKHRVEKEGEGNKTEKGKWARGKAGT